jgi:hypothetical protein
VKNKSDNESHEDDSEDYYEDEDSGEDIIEIKVASNLDNKMTMVDL